MALRKMCRCVILSLALSLILSGVTLVVIRLAFFNSIWKRNLVLEPTSRSYRLWVKTPMPLFMELYLFNWTNSAELMRNKSIKAEFKEVGPFVFREIHERVNVTWNGTNNVVYNETRRWFFVAEKSVDLSTPISNLNVVVFTIAKAIEKKNLFVKGLVDFLIHEYREKIIITRPAREWLFDGMNDSLLEFMKKFSPDSVPYDKFGWFYGRNGSSAYDGVFNVDTGREDIYNLGLLRTWNYQSRTQVFPGECGKIRGTTTEMFAPLKRQQNSLTIFISDFCGPFTLSKVGSTYVHGLEGYRFVGDDRIFDNGTKYPESSCFCNGPCMPSGVRNEELCLKAPLFVSFPHFYLADPVYVNSIIGISPNKSEHEFVLVINPLTGLPLEVRAQLQINLRLQPISSVPMFSSVPEMFVPMMWFRQNVKVPETLVNQGLLLEVLQKTAYGLGSFLLLLGILIVGIQFALQRRLRSGHKELLIVPETCPEEGGQRDSESVLVNEDNS